MQSHLTCLRAFALLSSLVLSRSLPAPETAQEASLDDRGLSTEGVETLDGVPLSAIPEGGSAIAPQAVAIPASITSKWTATADSYEPGYPPSNAIDGNASTFWHTTWKPKVSPLPHYLQIDMKQNYLVNSISYKPRQDGVFNSNIEPRPDGPSNGNIGGHQVSLSTDGVNFGTPKVIGTWRDDGSVKTSIFEATKARYIRLTALTEAGNRGSWSSCAELQVFSTTTPAPKFNGVAAGEWSPTIDFPLVPVSAALEFNKGPNMGTLLTWSSYAASTYLGGNRGKYTLTASFNPLSQTVSQRTVTSTNHDMFCEGLNLDASGRILSTGGNNANKTSIFTPSTQEWTLGPNMRTPRGYHSQVLLSDGRTFAIGGSWSDSEGNKNGEVYSPPQNSWTALPGCPVAPMLTNDAQGVYRSDNHPWLFGWKNGWVFQAGPSKTMNWYNPSGSGGQISAGIRGNDDHAMCGAAIMYDALAGKILTVGGATNYQDVDATANAHIITLGNPAEKVTVQKIKPMSYQRIFSNGVVMPNGNVFITGGQVHGKPFSDATAVLQPEIWVANTTEFVKAAPMSIPRTYHSTAILLADATIFSGGGGLCGDC